MLRTAFLAFMILAASAFGCRAATADRILILKSARVLLLMAGDQVLRSYPVALGQVPGRKQFAGDKKTPEGRYVIDGRNPRSRFHLSLRLSYPNAADARRAHAAGLAPGGDIFIHGLPDDAEGMFGNADPVSFAKDWTEGCVAVGNRAIEEIWQLVSDGTVVEIKR
jgi:murein L,D-transpeptidase YafK